MLLTVAKGGSEIGDWMQFIIILLIIGGSVFGAIAKKLIAAFSPKDSEDSTKGLPTPPGAKPVTPPVARKAAAHPPPEQPTVDTRNLPPILAEIIEEVAGRRTEESQRRRQRQAPSREAQPQRVHPRPPQPPRGAPASAIQTLAPDEHLGHIHSAIDDQERRFESDVEHRLGRLRSSFDTKTPTVAPAIVPRAAGAFSMPTSAARLGVRELRRAVVLSEILAPPLALRASIDRV